MSKNCKKKTKAGDKVAKERQTYLNKLAKMERQVRNNPNDFIASHNLAVFRAEGQNAKGYGG